VERKLARAAQAVVEALGRRRGVWFAYEELLSRITDRRQAAYFDLGVEHGIAAARASQLHGASKSARAIAEHLVREVVGTGGRAAGSPGGGATGDVGAPGRQGVASRVAESRDVDLPRLNRIDHSASGPGERLLGSDRRGTTLSSPYRTRAQHGHRRGVWPPLGSERAATGHVAGRATASFAVSEGLP